MKCLLRWIILISLFAATLQAETRLELSLSDPLPYVGEPILATYTLRSDHPIGGRDPFDPKFPGWWSVPMEEGNVSDDGRTVRWVYRLSPQRSGRLILPAQSVATTHMDPTSYAITRTHHRTADRPIPVRQLPAGVSIVGDFRLDEIFEHNSTRPNSPASLTVVIEGEGNIDDIPPFDLNLTDALVLASKPQRLYTRKEGRLHARFTQRFTIVADHTLTIPPLRLTLFNPVTRLVEILQSTPHTLKIKGLSKTQVRPWLPWLLTVAGFASGILAAWLWQKRPRRTRPRSSLGKSIRRARDDAQRYRLLLPCADYREIQPFLRVLEANLFRGEKEKIDYGALQRTVDVLCARN